jgi:hypothetical protein
MIEKKFVENGIKKAKLEEYLRRSSAERTTVIST